MTTKKISLLLCFQSFLCAKHFFKQRLFYSRSFQKYSRTSVENSRTFQGYPTIFQFSRTFQAHDAFSRTFQGPCEPNKLSNYSSWKCRDYLKGLGRHEPVYAFLVPLLLETVTKIQNQGMRNEGTGRRKICTCKQKILQRGVKPLFGVVFRDFHCYKNNRNSQAVRVLILRTG